MSTSTKITGYKTKCLLNQVQIALFDKSVDGCVFAYNEFLALVNAEYAITGKISTKCCSVKELRNNNPWLKELSSRVIDGARLNLLDAFNRFFTKQNDFPTFKNRYSKRSLRHAGDCYLYMKNGYMYAFIPKIGHVKLLTDFADSPNKFDYTTVSGVTLSQDSLGNFYVSFHAKSTTAHLPKTYKTVGIDPGLTTFATLSTGKKIKNPRFRERTEDRMKALQRKLAKCTKNSRRYNKYKKQIAALHQKSANQLNDFHKKAANKITKGYDHICIEKTQTKNMMSRGKKKTKSPRRLGKSFAQVGISAFREILIKKAELVGKQVHLVPARNTTKTCSSCGHIHNDLTLKDRTWICPVCGIDHDRDINAARNILQKGQAIRFTGGGLVALGNNTGLPKQKRMPQSGTRPVSKSTSLATSSTSSLPVI
jgi:putative transposase